MAPVEEEEKEKSFSLGINLETPAEPLLTSAMIEEKIIETQEPKKRGRKPGTTNKKSSEPAPVPEYVKVMFAPLLVGVHNGLLKLLKLSLMDKEQEKMVVDGYAMLLNKRIPSIIENHGDIIAAVGATAYVFGAKLATETKMFEFGKAKEKVNTTEKKPEETKDERDTFFN
jgi:hypothetical protein